VQKKNSLDVVFISKVLFVYQQVIIVQEKIVFEKHISFLCNPPIYRASHSLVPRPLSTLNVRMRKILTGCIY
jgi:hypothetical protein